MLSVLHEAGKQLVRDCPEMLLGLLRDQPGIAVPSYGKVQLEEADLSQVLPQELRADAVLHLLEPNSVRMGLVVEVQLRSDPRKRFSWPLYAAALHARIERQVCLVVVTFDAAVARWAAQPILTQQLGSSFVPGVLGPEQVPRIDSPEQARRMPHLAVLSALCHGKARGGEEVVRAAFGGLAPLEPEKQELYLKMVGAALGEVALNVLEAMMTSQLDFFAGEFAKIIEARAKARGEAIGRAEAILLVLEGRGIAVDEPTRAKILDCMDKATLDRWLLRGSRATSLAEVFAED